MGWTFNYGQRRAELIAERTKPQEWTHETTLTRDVVLAHCFRGGVFAGVFYAVHERARTENGVQGAPERWLEVTLMQCHTFSGYGPSWGYKDMEETMGPGEVSCPLGYLEMVPEPKCDADCPKDGHGHVWAREWRARVREYHAARAKQAEMVKGAKVGDVIELKEGCRPEKLEVSSLKPLRGWWGMTEYKVKKTQVARVIPKATVQA